MVIFALTNYEREHMMTLRSHLGAGVVCATLVLVLAGCSSDAAPAPSSSSSATDSATPNPAETATPKEIAELQAEAKVLFGTLPAADWIFNYGDEGSSAIRENSLDVAGLKTWITTLEADGWAFTPSEDAEDSLVGYLLKDDRVISLIASTNPDNNVPTTAIFYYSDLAWAGTSTQS